MGQNMKKQPESHMQDFREILIIDSKKLFLACLQDSIKCPNKSSHNVRLNSCMPLGSYPDYHYMITSIRFFLLHVR